MGKKYLVLGILLLILTSSFAFFGCGEDDEVIIVRKDFDIFINYVQYPVLEDGSVAENKTKLILVCTRMVATPDIAVEIEILNKSLKVIDKFVLNIAKNACKTEYLEVERDFSYQSCNDLNLKWTKIS